MKTSIVVAAVVAHALMITGCALHKTVRVKEPLSDLRLLSDKDLPNAGDKPYSDASDWMRDQMALYVTDMPYADLEKMEINVVQDDLDHEMILRPGDHDMWREAVRKTMRDFDVMARYDAELHKRDVL